MDSFLKLVYRMSYVKEWMPSERVQYDAYFLHIVQLITSCMWGEIKYPLGVFLPTAQHYHLLWNIQYILVCV